MIAYELKKVVHIWKVWMISPTRVIGVWVKVSPLRIIYKICHVFAGFTYNHHSACNTIVTGYSRDLACWNGRGHNINTQIINFLKGIYLNVNMVKRTYFMKPSSLGDFLYRRTFTSSLVVVMRHVLDKGIRLVIIFIH